MHTPLLNSIKQIIPLDEEDTLFIKNIFHEKSINKGDFFIREGQIAREIAFVVKGVFSYYWNDDGETKLFYFSQQGGLMTNYKSFMEKSPSEIYIECLADAVLLKLSYDDLQRLFTNVKQGEKYGRIIFEKLFLEAIQSLNTSYRKSPEERYLQFMDLYPDLLDTIPQYLIASYIGIKPQSLSRIKKRMK